EAVEYEMDPGEEVDEEVARDAGSVVAVVAPAEEADGFEGALGRATEEAVPVDVLGGGVGRDGVLPRADGGIAVEVDVDVVELADDAGGEELLGLGVDDGADALAADLEDAAGLARGFDDAEPLVDPLD